MWASPDFSEECPLCGRPGCTERIGFYHREYVDKDGRFYEKLPIFRYKCNSDDRLFKDKTFSLLPKQIVPYHKYSVYIIAKTVNDKVVLQNQNQEILDEIYQIGKKEIIPITVKTISDYQVLIEESHKKYIAVKNIEIEFISYVKLLFDNPEKEIADFYKIQNVPEYKRDFLIGRASHKR